MGKFWSGKFSKYVENHLLLPANRLESVLAMQVHMYMQLIHQYYILQLIQPICQCLPLQNLCKYCNTQADIHTKGVEGLG